ncbi:radical SAM protein [Methanotorris formicicus]|uniref:Radical SAM domain protein n=1 Tax=Methanotorris formicicus Mc-S-70 TaxID=647171 RepID=H1KYL3_9EURY|nr:radical SAM protein [Methanotorris formicicus]EHP87053.1 Radical SAM domain protein [Methanotorris formicicus Mc-S-70]
MKYPILKVTNRCNLNCLYCYAFNKNNKDMDFETAKNAVDYILKIDDKLKIQFTGGEPLLNFDLIERIIDYCNENYSDKYISYAIQTNGTLLNEKIVKKINKLGIKIGISIDGLEVNNTLRPYKNKKPSTIDTLRGIYLLKEYNVPFGVTIVVTNKNLPCIKEFVEYLIALGIRSISFNLLKPKKKEHLKLMPNEDEFNKILDELRDYPIYIKNIRREEKLNKKYCFLNNGDLLFVNEFGNIYPCPTLEGYFYMGNINKIDKENLKLFKVDCNDCFARKFLIKNVGR